MLIQQKYWEFVETPQKVQLIQSINFRQKLTEMKLNQFQCLYPNKLNVCTQAMCTMVYLGLLESAGEKVDYFLSINSDMDFFFEPPSQGHLPFCHPVWGCAALVWMLNLIMETSLKSVLPIWYQCLAPSLSTSSILSILILEEKLPKVKNRCNTMSHTPFPLNQLISLDL